MILVVSYGRFPFRNKWQKPESNLLSISINLYSWNQPQSPKKKDAPRFPGLFYTLRYSNLYNSYETYQLVQLQIKNLLDQLF